MSGAVKHGRNLAGDTYAARGVLVELALTGLGYDYFWHCGLSFPCIGHGKQLSATSFQLVLLARTESPAPFVEKQLFAALFLLRNALDSTQSTSHVLVFAHYKGQSL